LPHGVIEEAEAFGALFGGEGFGFGGMRISFRVRGKERLMAMFMDDWYTILVSLTRWIALRKGPKNVPPERDKGA
jgi:hypothetical protein